MMTMLQRCSVLTEHYSHEKLIKEKNNFKYLNQCQKVLRFL